MIPPEERLAAAVERYKTHPCPKCSGTRWWVHLLNDKTRKLRADGTYHLRIGRTCLDCAAAEARNRYVSEKHSKRCAIYRQDLKQRCQTNTELARTVKLKHNEAMRKVMNNASDNLTDYYIVRHIVNFYAEKQLKSSDIPQQLIETTRKFIQLNRQFNLNGQGKSIESSISG